MYDTRCITHIDTGNKMPITLHKEIPISAVMSFIHNNDFDVIDHGNGAIEIVVKDKRVVDPEFKIKRQAE